MEAHHRLILYFFLSDFYKKNDMQTHIGQHITREDIIKNFGFAS